MTCASAPTALASLRRLLADAGPNGMVSVESVDLALSEVRGSLVDALDPESSQDDREHDVKQIVKSLAP